MTRCVQRAQDYGLANFRLRGGRRKNGDYSQAACSRPERPGLKIPDDVVSANVKLLKIHADDVVAGFKLLKIRPDHVRQFKNS